MKQSIEDHLSHLDWTLRLWKSTLTHWLIAPWDWSVAGQLSDGHLSTWDRALYAHVHIGATKSGLDLHHFGARYAPPSDTLPPHETTVSISACPLDFNIHACCGPDMTSDRRSGGELRSGCQILLVPLLNFYPLLTLDSFHLCLEIVPHRKCAGKNAIVISFSCSVC
jgi:hypothetical protein